MKLPRPFRILWQRIIRGWDDSDTWSLDIPIARFVLPRLRRFKELNNGYPPLLTEKTWDETIDKMIVAMELVVKNDEDVLTKHDWEVMAEGLRLFGENMAHLWW